MITDLLGRMVFAEPARGADLMAEFSETEEYTAHDILEAAHLTADPHLREGLLRHAADEAAHTRIFSHQSHSWGSGNPIAPDFQGGGSAVDVDAPGGLYARLGEVRYVAFLHEAEKRAVKQLRAYLRSATTDPARLEVFERILQDEERHVRYTGEQLERWRGEGRGGEVRGALLLVRWERVRETWKTMALRTVKMLLSVLSGVLYFTAMAPFALVARLTGAGCPPKGWSKPDPVTPGLDDLRREY